MEEKKGVLVPFSDIQIRFDVIGTEISVRSLRYTDISCKQIYIYIGKKVPRRQRLTASMEIYLSNYEMKNILSQINIMLKEGKTLPKSDYQKP